MMHDSGPVPAFTLEQFRNMGGERNPEDADRPREVFHIPPTPEQEKLSEDGLYCRAPFQHVRKAWDATTLSELFRCPRRFDYSMQQGFGPPGARTDLVFGQGFHSGLEALDIAFLDGKPHAEAIDLALAAALESVSRQSDGSWKLFTGDMTEKRGGYKTAATLLRAVQWYAEDNYPGPITPMRMPNGAPAIEVSFRIPLPITAPDGDRYLLIGHLDGMGTMGNFASYVRERKTTKSALGQFYWKQWNPAIQPFTYDLAASVLYKGQDWLPPLQGVMMEAAQIGVNFARFERKPIPRTEGQREEWLATIVSKIQEYERRALLPPSDVGEEGRFAPNYAACSMYGGCHFAPVCTQDPTRQQITLEQQYEKRPLWNPMEVR